MSNRTAASGGTAGASTAPRPPSEIKADIKVRQARLASTVDSIADRVAPKNVIARTKASVVEKFVDPETGPRYDRIAIVAGVVVGLVALRVWRSRR